MQRHLQWNDSPGNEKGGMPGAECQLLISHFRRRAACASSLASAFSSRRTWEMENASERASFRQVQCKE